MSTPNGGAGGGGSGGGVAGTTGGAAGSVAGTGADASAAGSCGSSASCATGAGGGAGVGGAGGLGDGGIGEGVLSTCPGDVSNGAACPLEGVVCPFATKSCACKGGTWSCNSCPPAQVLNGGSCTARAMCRYDTLGELAANGPATCSCGILPGAAWGCGICPTDRPTPGTVCGNSRLACAYGDEMCGCDAVKGWTCVTPACPADPNGPVASCGSLLPGYVCRYPSVDQNCSCESGAASRITCSCPAARPAEGSACIRPFTACNYPEKSCSCTGGQWRCTAVCPVGVQRLSGPCSDVLVCNLEDGTHCVCDGVSWSCS